MSVVCRFAPSPTGRMHLGNARTGLFNWAFARHAGGSFLLRIEDTDAQRSKQEHVKGILDALDWLGLDHDGDPIYQSQRLELHRQRAHELLEQGKAYRCYATPAELDELRAQQEARGEKPRYDRRWRDRNDQPPGKPYCIRFATPLTGGSRINDIVRGEVVVANSELDDLVILRMDGTPTYNFAAAVDDIDMQVTHIIRGEDHLTNTLRQQHIHAAFGAAGIEHAHLPMILGRRLDADGNPLVNDDGEAVYERMSKRNQAVDVDHYRSAGFLADAMVNYLAQLGWTQPDAEIYTPRQLAEAFDLAKVNRSAARFDLERLRWINQQHMRSQKPQQLASMAGIAASDNAIEVACEKAHTLTELARDLAWLQTPELDAQLLARYVDDANRPAIEEFLAGIDGLEPFDEETVAALIKRLCKAHGLKFPQLGMPLRIALTGSEQSPQIAWLAAELGAAECKSRLAAALRA